jgi:predicted DsbA family dithiol-disulfide isomerase
MRIDFVSDVVCPWCAIGLASLQQAAAEVADVTGPLEWHVQPFELNPQMVPEGEDIGEHLARKYGSTPEQGEATREMIRQRGAALGFEFRMDKRSRIWNTLDAHRLLHWAGTLGHAEQLALKQALLRAYFTEGENPGNHEVLLAEVRALGLDEVGAQQVLSSELYTEEVREMEQFWQQAGIHSVPAVIINQRHLISGGQPPEVFAQALRQIAAEAGSAPA